MTAEFQYFADRALQEAVRAIDAKPGAPRRAHEELARAYSRRVIDALGNETASCGVLVSQRRTT